MNLDENLIGYCGLYCGDCVGYTGVIADLAKDLRKEMRKAKFDIIADAIPIKEFKHYKDAYEFLGALVRLRCRKTCRGDGGPPSCEIRKCSRKKPYDGCWECEEFEECQKLKVLELLHKDSHIKNLRKIRRVGIKEWFEGKRYW